jgi:hypothetical protein
MHHSPHSVPAGSLQNGSCALNVGPVHLLGIAHPEPVIGGYVKHGVASRDRLFDRGRITEVSDHPLGVQALNVLGITASPNQQPQIGALLGQNAGHVTANKSGSASDESLHLSCQLSAFSYRLKCTSLKADG